MADYNYIYNPATGKMEKRYPGAHPNLGNITVIMDSNHPTNEAEFNAYIKNPPPGANIATEGRVNPYPTDPAEVQRIEDEYQRQIREQRAQADNPVSRDKVVDNSVLTREEKAAIMTGYQKRKAELAAQRQQDNAVLDAMGLRTGYTESKTEGGKVYGRSLRSGEWEEIGTVREGPTRDQYDDTVGLKNYTFAESPTGVRIYNEESGVVEVGVRGDGGRWVPESEVLTLEGPEPVISQRSRYEPFQIMAPVTDNLGRVSQKPAFVLSYDTRLVFEPGGRSYELAVGPTGKKLDPWGGYDPERRAFVVTVGGSYAEDVDTLGEIMLGRGSPVDLEGDLRHLYGESRMDEFASMAINTPKKHTFVTVTTPPTPYKTGLVTTYDIGDYDFTDFNAEDFKRGGEATINSAWGMGKPLVGGESDVVNSMSSVGYGELRAARVNPIDTGHDPFGIVGWLVPRHAPLREFFAPDTWEPLLTRPISDPYYSTSAGQAEINNYALVVGTGLAGTAPVGLARGFSLVDDVIMKVPVARDAYSSVSGVFSPVVKTVDDGLGRVGLSHSVPEAVGGATGRASVGAGKPVTSGLTLGEIYGKTTSVIAKTPSFAGRTVIRAGKEADYIVRHYPGYAADVVSSLPRDVPAMVKGGALRVSAGFERGMAGAEYRVGVFQKRTLDTVGRASTGARDFYNVRVKGGVGQLGYKVRGAPSRIAFNVDSGLAAAEQRVGLAQERMVGRISRASTGAREFYASYVQGGPTRVSYFFDDLMHSLEVSVGRLQARTMDRIYSVSTRASDYYNLGLRGGIGRARTRLRGLPGRVYSRARTGLEKGLLDAESAVGDVQARAVAGIERTSLGARRAYHEGVVGGYYRARYAAMDVVNLDNLEKGVGRIQGRALDTILDTSTRASDYYNLRLRKGYYKLSGDIIGSVENVPDNLRRGATKAMMGARMEWESYTPLASRLVYPRFDGSLRAVGAPGRSLRSLQAIRLRRVRPDVLTKEDLVSSATAKNMATKKRTVTSQPMPGALYGGGEYRSGEQLLVFNPQQAAARPAMRTRILSPRLAAMGLDMVTPTRIKAEIPDFKLGQESGVKPRTSSLLRSDVLPKLKSDDDTSHRFTMRIDQRQANLTKRAYDRMTRRATMMKTLMRQSTRQRARLPFLYYENKPLLEKPKRLPKTLANTSWMYRGVFDSGFKMDFGLPTKSKKRHKGVDFFAGLW